MAAPVIMPRQGQSVESCIIAKWYKQKGDLVKLGDLLFAYETDKAAFDEEAKIEGTMLEIFFDEGDDVPVLTNVCVIGNVGESTVEFNPKNSGVSKEVDTPKKEAQKPSPHQGLETIDNSVSPVTFHAQAEIKISPRAKNLAIESGIDYRYADPTGPEGRIIERDILKLHETGPKYTPAVKDEYLKSGIAPGVVNYLSGTGIGGRITTHDLASAGESSMQAQTSGFATEEYTEVKLSNIRKAIAGAMRNSLASTAQLTLHSSFDASNILTFRRTLKEISEKVGNGENITLNDMILFAVSRTIQNHPDLNAHFLEDRVLHVKNVHLGIAVDTERGLIVPTVFNANKKSLAELSAEVKNLAKGCQKGAINPDHLKGASFTVTNLGTLGIESFTPILNPPQTGILGVNCITQRVKEVDGQYQFYPAMGLSITFDHRALDGAPAARFLQELKEYLENFSEKVSK